MIRRRLLLLLLLLSLRTMSLAFPILFIYLLASSRDL